MSAPDVPFEVHRALHEVRVELDQMLREAYPDADVDVHVEYNTTSILAHRASTFIPISFEMAIGAGLMAEADARRGWTPPPALPAVPWRTRAHWRLASWRMAAGWRIGSWIAGMDLSEQDD